MSHRRRSHSLVRLIAVAGVAVTVCPAGAQAFNPQPEPPGVGAKALSSQPQTAGVRASTFNPQPDPPGIA